MEKDTRNEPHNPSLCLGPHGFLNVLFSNISLNLYGLSVIPGFCHHQSQVTATVSQAIFLFLDFSFQSISSSLSVHDCHLNHVIVFSCSATNTFLINFQEFCPISVIRSVSNHTHHVVPAVKPACSHLF